MPITLTIYALLSSLVIGSVAIAVLARKLEKGLLAQTGGFIAAILGLAVFVLVPSYLPHSATRYNEVLSFGTSYLGQTLIFLWLALQTRSRG